MYSNLPQIQFPDQEAEEPSTGTSSGGESTEFHQSLLDYTTLLPTPSNNHGFFANSQISGPNGWNIPSDPSMLPDWTLPFENVDLSSSLHSLVHGQHPPSSSIATPELQPHLYIPESRGWGAFIPQRRYRPQKYLEDPITEEIIRFSVAGGGGILVTDALQRNFNELDGRDDPMLENCGTSISVRLEWPEYQPWSHQIKTHNFCKTPSPIKRSKLATEIAKQLERFIDEKKSESQAGMQWPVGPGFIETHHLVLVSLQRVSKGSWQPHFCLIR